MAKNDYYVIQGENYKQMAIQILEAANLAAAIGDKQKRIGIKPNILGAQKASMGAVTHPELADGVLSYLKKEGFLHLVVLEGSWVGDLSTGQRDLRRLQKASGTVCGFAEGFFSDAGCGGNADIGLRRGAAAGLPDQPAGIKGALPDDGDLCAEKQQGTDSKL